VLNDDTNWRLVTQVEMSTTEKPASRSGLGQFKALITAGGIGTRLLPFSKEIPKEMFPIVTRNGDESLQLKPVIQAIFEQLHNAGIRTFYIVVGRGKRAIEDHFSPDLQFLEYLAKKGKANENLTHFYEKIRSSDLVFLNQFEPLGFGDAVLLGRTVIHGPFLVQAADTFILSERNDYLTRLATMHEKYHADATVLLQEVPDPRHYGVVEGDSIEEGVLWVKRAVEKPSEPRSHHAIMPIYLFTDEIFDALSQIPPGVGGELQLTDAIQSLASRGKRVVGVSLRDDERRLDIGSLETMLEALKVSLIHVEEAPTLVSDGGRAIPTADQSSEINPSSPGATSESKRPLEARSQVQKIPRGRKRAGEQVVAATHQRSKGTTRSRGE
jgi:UTP--glucose-1-phosphate uridylyltransferase